MAQLRAFMEASRVVHRYFHIVSNFEKNLIGYTFFQIKCAKFC